MKRLGNIALVRLTRDQLTDIEKNACPGFGSCGGMYTANTMSSAIEAMGMSLPYSSTMSNEDKEKELNAQKSAQALFPMLEKNITPKDILTREAFENAISVVMAVGGSTNAVLHLLAISSYMNLDLTIDDFEIVRKRVPHFCDLKPSGQFVTVDLHPCWRHPTSNEDATKQGTFTWRLYDRYGKNCIGESQRCSRAKPITAKK